MYAIISSVNNLVEIQASRDNTHVKNGGKLYCHGHSISAIVSVVNYRRRRRQLSHAWYEIL